MATARQLIGLDENGLGPRLGPMVVTGVRLSVTATETDYHRATRSAQIGDSKRVCAHGAMSHVESLVLSLLAVHLHARPASLDALLATVSLLDEVALRSLCPPGEAPVACLGSPVPLPAYGPGITPEFITLAETLRERGVALHAVQSALACPKRLNLARASGQSRFDVDLNLMIELFTSLHQRTPTDGVTITCGKVGGRKAYGEALGRRHALVSALHETAALSAYRLPGIGTVAFVMDGDATDPAISLASLFGKYVRELTMARLHRYYAAAVENLATASGYHDPVTARFIHATALVRATRGIPAQCFER